MLKLFEKNTGLQSVLVILVLVVLWLPSLLAPQPMEAPMGHAPLYELLYRIAMPPIAAVIIAMVLVLTGGVLFNIQLVNKGMVSQNSLMPTLMFIMAMSASEHTLSPTLIMGVASVGVVGLLLLKSTPIALPADKICNATALIGITSMFYQPALLLLLTYIFVTFNYGLYRWKDYIAMLLGLLAPYIALWCTLYMSDNMDGYWQALAGSLTDVHIMYSPLDTPQAIANAVLVLFFIVSFFILWAKIGENPMLWQKNATTLMIPTITGIFTLFYSQVFPARLSLFAITFAFCCALRFLRPRSHAMRRPAKRRHAIPVYDILFVIILIATFIC